MATYLLFYSNKCRYSQDFIKKLENFPEINFNFKKLCVDKDKYGILKNEIKSAIKHYKIVGVPTIIINNSPLLGEDAEKWLLNEVANNRINPVYPSMAKRDYSQDMNVNIKSIQPMSADFDSQFQSPDNRFSIEGMNVGTGQMQGAAPSNMKPIPKELEPISCSSKDTNIDDALEQLQRGRQQFQNHY